MSDRQRALLAPLMIALIGIIPLGLIAAARGPSAEPTTTEAAIPDSLPEPGPEQVVVTTPPPVIGGVSEEIARVLAAQGFAAEQTVAGLPDSVTAVLREHGVVLTVAVPES